jgi:hypothetical protein
MASRSSERRIAVFVGERYLPSVSREQAMAVAERLRAAAANLAREGSAVRLLSTTFVPDEEWMFDLIEAARPEEVERIYAMAGVAVERLSLAIHIDQNGAGEGTELKGRSKRWSVRSGPGA